MLYRYLTEMNSVEEDVWDTQIAEDAEFGRLDALVEEALIEYRAGIALPFPEDESSAHTPQSGI